jgi:hypothetical protein
MEKYQPPNHQTTKNNTKILLVGYIDSFYTGNFFIGITCSLITFNSPADPPTGRTAGEGQLRPDRFAKPVRSGATVRPVLFITFVPKR